MKGCGSEPILYERLAAPGGRCRIVAAVSAAGIRDCRPAKCERRENPVPAPAGFAGAFLLVLAVFHGPMGAADSHGGAGRRPTIWPFLSHAHFWDITAIDALDRIVHKFRRNGIDIEVAGLNRASATMIEKYAKHDKDKSAGLVSAH
jgi:hypothetical protein